MRSLYHIPTVRDEDELSASDCERNVGNSRDYRGTNPHSLATVFSGKQHMQSHTMKTLDNFRRRVGYWLWFYAVAGLITHPVIVQSAEPSVSLTRGESTIKITSDNEVLGVYRFSKDHKKPYLTGVSAPGGLDILTAELKNGTKPDELPGHKVFVVSESVPVEGTDGKASFEEVLTVSKVGDKGVYVDEKQGWLKPTDVVPLNKMVTRVVEVPGKSKGYDHPHHKGVWNSVDEVNEIKFWKEDGRIDNVSINILESTGNPARMKIVNQWKDDDGKPVLDETTIVSIFPNRMFVYDITFKAAGDKATFLDTKEGMFAIRMPDWMREKDAHGPVINADGLEGTKPCWGRTSAWIDYVGPLGSQMYGVTLMDHPKNPWPSRYHVRDYGLFSLNPFGAEAYTKGTDDPQPAHPLTIKGDETFHVRYGMYIHRGNVEEGKVAAAYNEFVELDQ